MSVPGAEHEDDDPGVERDLDALVEEVEGTADPDGGCTEEGEGSGCGFLFV